MRSQFLANGYSQIDVDRGMRPILDRQDKPVREKKPVVRVSYLGKPYHRLARLMHQFHIQAIPCPHRTIRQLISKPKDELPAKLRQNVCYQLDCSCGSIYVGETGRVAEIRWKEHKKQYADCEERKEKANREGRRWNFEAESSSFKAHLEHRPDFALGTILSSHSNERERINQEGLYIRRAHLQGLGTILNTNSGRQLDPVFDSVISLTKPLLKPITEENGNAVLSD